MAAVDVGGAGAARRARDAPFADWGVPGRGRRAEAVLLAPGLPVVAGGPLRDGVEVAACLGARRDAPPASTRPFAGAAPEAAGATAAALVHQLRVATWAAGAPSAAALGPGHLRVRGLT